MSRLWVLAFSSLAFFLLAVCNASAGTWADVMQGVKETSVGPGEVLWVEKVDATTYRLWRRPKNTEDTTVSWKATKWEFPTEHPTPSEAAALQPGGGCESGFNGTMLTGAPDFSHSPVSNYTGTWFGGGGKNATSCFISTGGSVPFYSRNFG